MNLHGNLTTKTRTVIGTVSLCKTGYLRKLKAIMTALMLVKTLGIK